jgi:hypothetical protein
VQPEPCQWRKAFFFVPVCIIVRILKSARYLQQAEQADQHQIGILSVHCPLAWSFSASSLHNFVSSAVAYSTGVRKRRK